MEGAHRASGSILEIVDSGLKLATTLQARAEAFEERFSDTALAVNSTASVLKQLQEMIDTDQANGDGQKNPIIFKDEGRNEVESLALQCGKAYTTIVALVIKAGTPKGKDRIVASSIDGRILRASSLGRSWKWSWLAPRIRRCEEQLKWLRTNLLFDLQLALLPQFQIHTPERLPGSFDEELSLRAMAELLRLRKIRCVKSLTSKLKAANEGDSSYEANTVSISYPPSAMSAENSHSRPKRDKNPEDLAPSGASSELGVENPPLEINGEEQESFSSNTLPKLDGGKKETSLKQSTMSPKSASSVTSSDTLVHDPEKEKMHEAKMEESVIKEIVIEGCPQSSIHPKAEIQQENLHEGSSSIEIPEVIRDNDKLRPRINDLKVEILTLPVHDNKSSVLPSWLKDLFGHGDKILHDWESPTLEAYFIQENPQTLLKLPFGHQRLTSGLKRMTKKHKDLSWDQYHALDLQHHRAIDLAVGYVKQLDSRHRTCLAIYIHKYKQSPDAERMLVFFSLGAPVEPVRLNDCVGRKFSFPFEHCRTWKLMKELIDQTFLHVEGLGPHVNECHYDLVTKKGNIVLPLLWEATVKPGFFLTMHMWRFPGPPYPLPASKPPRAPPPLPPPPAMTDYSELSDCESEDSCRLVFDPDLGDEIEDLGIEIDFDMEAEKAELSLSEFLGKWTNATDPLGEIPYHDGDESDSGGSWINE